MRSARREEQDELDELPPLEREPNEDLEGPEADETPLLDPVEEDVALDEEEGLAADLEVGLTLDEASTEADEPEEFVLDIAALLSPTEEAPPGDEADDAGPRELDLAADLVEQPETWSDAAEEGVEEPSSDLVSDEELPELDADEPGGVEDEAWLATDALRDEDLPAASAEPWSAQELASPGLEPEAVTVIGDEVWVAGSALAKVEGDRVRVLDATFGRSLDLCAAGTHVLVRGATGEIFRHGRDGRGTRVTSHREALGLKPGEIAEVMVHSFPDASEAGALAHAGSSRLALSTDEGLSWTSTELGGRIIAVTREKPVRLLLCGAEEHALSRFRSGRWERRPLPALAAEVAASERVYAAGSGELVALASAERGLVVSTDGGANFLRVPGCLHVSALCAGTWRGRAMLWLSVFLESEERALVLAVDPVQGRAEIVAELRSRDDDAALDGYDARVRSLAWSAHSERLWVATGAGLYRLGPR